MRDSVKWFCFWLGKIISFFSPKHPDKLRGPSSPIITGFRRRFPGNVKAKLKSNVEGKNAWSSTSVPPCAVITWWVTGHANSVTFTEKRGSGRSTYTYHCTTQGSRWIKNQVNRSFAELSKCLHPSCLNGPSPAVELICKWKQVAPALQGFQLKFFSFILDILLSNEDWKRMLVCTIYYIPLVHNNINIFILVINQLDA